MDQAPWQEIDVHEGIENTLIILGHKLRNVTVNRDFDRTLPRLWAYRGELNLERRTHYAETQSNKRSLSNLVGILEALFCQENHATEGNQSIFEREYWRLYRASG